MSGFSERYNTDEVFLRNMITSFLRALNEKLTYIQVDDQQNVLEVFVPFYYSLTGDESFLQDFFIEYQNCVTDQPPAEGNYDPVPRGVVVLGDVQIDTSGIMNPNVRTSYTQEDTAGTMRTLSSYTKPLLLNVSFDLKIIMDTMLDTFKMFQSTLTTFYKTFVFYFDYEGFRIYCIAGFPESYPNDKQFEFSYGNQQKNITMSFNVAVQTYFPEKDITTERFRGNLMQAGIKMVQKVNPNPGTANNTRIL